MKRILTMALASGLAVGAGACIELLEDARVAVNLTGLRGTFVVPTGTTTFAVCTTVDAGDYLDVDFVDVSNARIYDVRVRTLGVWGGSLTSFTVEANSGTFLTGWGSWAEYQTQRSVLTSSSIQAHSEGIGALLSAVNNRSPVSFCASGSLSEAAPAGLSLEVEILGQVDALL